MATTTGRTQALTISMQEAADRLGINLFTLKKLVYQGEIPSIKLGARRLVPVVAIDRMIANAMEGGDRHDA